MAFWLLLFAFGGHRSTAAKVGSQHGHVTFWREAGGVSLRQAYASQSVFMRWWTALEGSVRVRTSVGGCLGLLVPLALLGLSSPSSVGDARITNGIGSKPIPCAEEGHGGLGKVSRMKESLAGV